MLHKHRGNSLVGAFCERPRANTVRPYGLGFLLLYKHRISKGEEAILFLYCKAVVCHHLFLVVER